jgi:hypothetical protein
MLVSEKKLSSADGVLLWPASRGASYQTAGAFQRLGGRLWGVIAPEDSTTLPSKLPLKHVEWQAGRTPKEIFGEKPAFRTLIWTPHPALSWNEEPEPSELQSVIETVRFMAALDPDFHPIFVLPRCSSRALLKELQASSPRATILLTPMAFGFRDDALFDQSLQILQQNPAQLRRLSKDARLARPIHGISFLDLAAYLIVAPQNEALMGKNIWLQGAEWTLLEWLQEFCGAFPKNVGRLDQVRAWLQSTGPFSEELLGRIFASRENFTESSSPSLDFVVHSEADFFPSPAPQLRRALEQHSQAFARFPELELVFTPGRGL